MPSLPLDPPLLDLFQTTTSSGDDAPSVRIVLVQTAPTGKSLSLIESLPPQGTDKEDFEPLLSKVFSKEPTRSGYALYRLDSQAANGEWEWLCIAYQPDGAKVKEKMQYTLTRTSLIDGLNERHFLETIYATSSGDFRFPNKLRNARKHDYQNPQQKTAGRLASEAAGTDAGGARRTFGTRATQSNDNKPTPTAVKTPEQDNKPTTTAVKSTEEKEKAETDEIIQRDSLLAETQAAPQKGAPLDALAETAAAGTTTNGEEEASIAPSAPENNLPPADPVDAHAAQCQADKETSAVEPLNEPDHQEDLKEEVREQAQSEQKAPEEPPTRAGNELKEETLSQPQVPSPETARSHLGDIAKDAPVTKPKAESQTDVEAVSHEQSSSTRADKDASEVTAPAAANNAKAPHKESSYSEEVAASQGKTTSAAASAAGAGSMGGGNTAKNSGDGSSSGSSSSFTGPKNLEWTEEVEVALSGLSARLSGPSEHNFVSVLLSPSENSATQVELASPPRFIPPGDLSSTVESELVGQQSQGGVRFAFYRYPVEAETKKTVFMYTEPPSQGSNADKTLWANSLSAVQDKASQIIGFEVRRESVGAQYGPYPRPTPAQAEDVATRIQSIRYRIADAAKRSGRKDSPRLVAVSKLHPPSSIMAAYVHTGQKHFGENYVQEMVDKAKVLPQDIKWHFVGGLQSNKGKALAAIPNLYLLETLDSIKAANVLEKALASPDAAKREEPLRVYLQVNTSGEEAKSGLPPLTDSDSDSESPLYDLAHHVLTACPHLTLQGLMTIGSATNSKSNGSSEATSDQSAALEANPDFGTLFTSRKALISRLQKNNIGESLSEDNLELSMGMTNDFAIAISAGSGNVRIGTACFGDRPGSREEARKGMENELNMSNDSTSASAAGVGDKGFAKPKRPGASRK
ncbi:unnamed protein product [Sympodiomycopsis kandeliae]